MHTEEQKRSLGAKSTETSQEDGPLCCPGLIGDNAPIVILDLSQRARYALLEADITTVGQLGALPKRDLLQIRLIDTPLSERIQDSLEDYEESKPPGARELSPLAGQSVADLDLSASAHTALERAGIATVDQLAKLSGEQMLDIQGIGLEAVAEIREQVDAQRQQKAQASPSSSNASAPLLEALDLSTRAYNALRRAGYNTVAEIVRLTREELMCIRQVGGKTAEEIQAKLEDFLNSCPEADEDPVPIFHREPIDTVQLPQATSQGLAEQGIVTVGALLYSVANDRLPASCLDEASIAEVETRLGECFGDFRPSNPGEAVSVGRSGERGVAEVESGVHLNKRQVSPDVPIAALGLCARTRNALSRASVDTVGELVKLVESGDLMMIRNIGQKSAAEVEEVLTTTSIHRGEARSPEKKPEEGSEVEAQTVHVPILPAHIIDWQVDFLDRQVSAGLLHKQAQMGQTPVSDWLSSIGTLERREAYATMTSIIGSSLNVCDELEFLLDHIGRDDYLTVLLHRYGRKPQTLESIGSKIGVTRERVRQVGNRLEQEIGSQIKLGLTQQARGLGSRPPLLRMQSALLIARDMGLALTYDRWKRRITTSGLIGSWTSTRYSAIDPIEAMIAVCNLVADRQLSPLTIPSNLEYAIQLAASGSPKTRAKIARIRKTLPRETARLVRRHTRFSGAVHVRWLAQEMEKEPTQTAEILRALGYEPLSENWFVPRSPDVDGITGHDVFHHAVREMFQYCGRLATDEICSGLRLAVSRTRYPVPPPRVMDEILSMYGYRLEDGLWYWDEETDEELSRGERIVRQCIEKHGPVVHHSQLVEAFLESELSFPSLHATLGRSPIFERIDRALYKLRGTAVSHEDIGRAESASDRVRVDPRVSYDKSGHIIVTANLSAYSMGTGVLTSQRFPNLKGEWELLAKEKDFGTLQATEDEFRCLREPLQHLGCQPEDRVRLIFDVWERTVEVEKVQM